MHNWGGGGGEIQNSLDLKKRKIKVWDKLKERTDMACLFSLDTCIYVWLLNILIKFLIYNFYDNIFCNYNNFSEIFFLIYKIKIIGQSILVTWL